MRFKKGDLVCETDDKRRRGEIRQEPGYSRIYPTCYLVRLLPGHSIYCTKDEIEHVSAIERLGKLAE